MEITQRDPFFLARTAVPRAPPLVVMARARRAPQSRAQPGGAATVHRPGPLRRRRRPRPAPRSRQAPGRAAATSAPPTCCWPIRASLVGSALEAAWSAFGAAREAVGVNCEFAVAPIASACIFRSPPTSLNHELFASSINNKLSRQVQNQGGAARSF